MDADPQIPQSAMADPLIGRSLGPYDIRLLIGRGGMSTVYMGYQPAADRVVAIKVLPADRLDDDAFTTRFQREVRTIANLEHPHILPVYDVGEDDGQLYLVMRYVSGGTLSDLVRERLPDMKQVVRIVTQLADALDHAHEKGIVHGDVKPSNALLDAKGNVYLADFGIARLQQAGHGAAELAGTPGYLAPEIVRGEAAGPASDVYALGAVIYEMLTGEPPYVRPDPQATLDAHLNAPVPSVRDFDPNVNGAVDAVVKRAMAKAPADRFESAGALAGALRRAVDGAHPTLNVQPIPAEMQASPPWADAAPADAPTEPRGLPTLEQAGMLPESQPPRWQTARQPAPARRAKRPRRRTGCLVGFGVLLALLAGMTITAFALTGGAPESLLAVLTPIITLGPRPDRNPPGAATEAPGTDGGQDDGDAVPVPPAAASTQLAFTSNRDGDYEIYVIGVDGEGLQQITNNDQVVDFDPTWSPDGARLVYASTAGGDSELVVANADGSDARTITENRSRDADPAWSPDGEWIAFSSDRGGNFDIYRVRPDGSDVQQLTSSSLDEMNPAWSPDGQRITYYAVDPDDSDTAEIFISDIAGGPPERMTDNGALDQWPDWSPDGSRLVFTSANGIPDRRRSIFTLDIASGQTIRLTDSPGRDDDPVWSPDGRYIAFDSDQDGDGFFDLFILDLDTRDLRQITFENANDVAPAWRPGS